MSPVHAPSFPGLLLSTGSFNLFLVEPGLAHLQDLLDRAAGWLRGRCFGRQGGEDLLGREQGLDDVHRCRMDVPPLGPLPPAEVVLPFGRCRAELSPLRIQHAQREVIVQRRLHEGVGVPLAELEQEQAVGPRAGEGLGSGLPGFERREENTLDLRTAGFQTLRDLGRELLGEGFLALGLDGIGNPAIEGAFEKTGGSFAGRRGGFLRTRGSL